MIDGLTKDEQDFLESIATKLASREAERRVDEGFEELMEWDNIDRESPGKANAIIEKLEKTVGDKETVAAILIDLIDASVQRGLLRVDAEFSDESVSEMPVCVTENLRFEKNEEGKLTFEGGPEDHPHQGFDIAIRSSFSRKRF